MHKAPRPSNNRTHTNRKNGERGLEMVEDWVRTEEKSLGFSLTKTREKIFAEITNQRVNNDDDIEQLEREKEREEKERER